MYFPQSNTCIVLSSYLSQILLTWACKWLLQQWFEKIAGKYIGNGKRQLPAVNFFFLALCLLLKWHLLQHSFLALPCLYRQGYVFFENTHMLCSYPLSQYSCVYSCVSCWILDIRHKMQFQRLYIAKTVQSLVCTDTSMKRQQMV